MPRVPVQDLDQLASLSHALGFGENFFGSGELTQLVERYKAERSLHSSEVDVECRCETGRASS